MAISPTVIESTTLAPRTKQLYVDYITTIASQMYDGDYAKLVLNPALVVDFLETKQKASKSTTGIYVTAINKMVELTPDHKLPKTTVDEWQKALKDIRYQRMQMYDKNELTPTEVGRVVSFDELKKKFCEMQSSPDTIVKQKTHMQYILFAVFLNTKPKRADLGNVYMAQTVAEVPDAYRQHGNYIVLTGKPRLVMGMYKTSARYGRIIESLNPELISVLQDSLVRFPRQHLITQIKELVPYTKNNSYCQFVKRAFGDHFNKTMGASLWRHVYVAENVDFVKTSNEVLKKNARLSGQSLMTQLMIYKNINLPSNLRQKPANEVGAPVKCDPV